MYIGEKRVAKLYRGKRVIKALYYGAHRIWGTISSCFGSGWWRSALQWKRSDLWKY